MVKINSQIPNAGFEIWPLEKNGYPVNTAQLSTDHYPENFGKYSARVQNNLSLTTMEKYGFVNSAFYPGFNGATFPIFGHPTKLCGYYKYYPQNGDTLNIGVALYYNGTLVGGATFKNNETVSNWTAFSIDIPEYIQADSAQIGFAAFSSEYGKMPIGPYGNSVLYVDNISFNKLITSNKNKKVAIIKNFDDSENDSIKAYLNYMGLVSSIFDHNILEFDSISDCDLLIWDDLGYQSGGLTEKDVRIFKQFHQIGKPIYFIGDDLAFSSINLSNEYIQEWTNLIHLSGQNNFSQDYNIQLTNDLHPITNGAYGKVNNFDYGLDIDFAQKTNTGEFILAKTNDSDVILAYDGNPARTVTQNCLLVQSGSEASVIERKKLFQNAVCWLLDYTPYTNIMIPKNKPPFNLRITNNGLYLPTDFNYHYLAIYGIGGNKVLENNNNENYVDTRILQKGLYLIQIKTNKDIISMKYLKR